MSREGNARRGVSLLLVLMMFLGIARAEKLTFPEGLKQIEEEAFMGDRGITTVELPNSLTVLGARAFADCSKLREISIPESVTSLGEDFLKGCPSDVLIKTTPGSAAMRYALAHQLDYQADTKYRALLVGQTYENSPHFSSKEWLNGPANDIRAMKKGLEHFNGTPYQVRSEENLTVPEIILDISATFGGATERDVSLFYYSGHGDRNGALVGYDNKRLNPSDLRDVLNTIPGRKIVIIDACYSGKMISRSLTSESEGAGSAEDFVDFFMTAFTARSKGDLRGADYFVITAASGSEESWEVDNRGVFTEALLEGCGYDYAHDIYYLPLADVNKNYIVTLQEAYAYARAEALSKLANLNKKREQYAQVYPENCNWFGILRQ